MTSKNTIITLDQAEVMSGVYTGALRFYEAQTKGFSNGPDGANPNWDMSIEGALTEMAYAKFRNVYYGHPVNNFKGPDVGENVQIRSTHIETGSLIFRPADHETDYYVLVVGRMPTYRIVGWMLGADCKQEKWFRAPNGRPAAWFVPQQALNTFDGASVKPQTNGK